MNIPASIRAGSTIKWRESSQVDPFGDALQSTDSWVMKFYLRTNTASEGHTATGSTYGTGFEFTISASDSSAFDAGDWFWNCEVSKGSEKYVVGSGALEVLQALAYSGTPGAIQAKSQIEQDLDAIKAAIRTLVSGGVVKEYSIAGRSLKKYELSDLITLESRLKYQLKREQKANLIANGLGSPDSMYVRFN